jgi:hypothetical protein
METNEIRKGKYNKKNLKERKLQKKVLLQYLPTH